MNQDQINLVLRMYNLFTEISLECEQDDKFNDFISKQNIFKKVLMKYCATLIVLNLIKIVSKRRINIMKNKIILVDGEEYWLGATMGKYNEKYDCFMFGNCFVHRYDTIFK